MTRPFPDPASSSPRARSARPRLLAGMIACFAFTATPIPAESAPRPNFLLILSDDMGYSDIGSYGGEIQTPHLDRLAENGLRFTGFYNTSRCWSTRAALLTGYYPQAIRRDMLPDEDRGEYGMFGMSSGANGVRPRWARLLPAHLKQAGYRSYHSGKWHIDGDRLPAGFDRSYSLEDHNRFFSPENHFEDDQKLPPVPQDSGYYATTHIADHAIRCLKEHAEQHANQPFFGYLAFTAPHFPLHALPEDIAIYRDRYLEGWDKLRTERLAKIRERKLLHGELPPLETLVFPRWNLTQQEQVEQISPHEVAFAVPWDSLTPGQQRFQATKMAIHAAMIHRMDIEIGRVLAQIDAMGALDNTVVVFLTDNGASPEQILRGDGHDPTAAPGSARSYLGLGAGWSTAANTPFRLHKSWAHEGGIRTPLIIHWPAGIRERGSLRHQPGHVIDMVPTFLELAGVDAPEQVEGLPVPPMHGKSLVPVLRDAGIRDFRIYLDEESDTLFSVQTLAPDHSAAALRESELMRQWWKHMAPLMETNPDHSPVRTPLKEMFHQD
jgi:arylsulfatase A-like enzyme